MYGRGIKRFNGPSARSRRNSSSHRRSADLARLVAAQSSKLVGIGLVLGLGLMWVLRQLVRSAGGAGSFFDPQWSAFAVPMPIVAVIGIVATWLPSRRARRIDPAHLLQSP